MIYFQQGRDALELAEKAARDAVRIAQARGASGETVAALQAGLAAVAAESKRVGRGPICECGEVLGDHDLDGKRVDEARDGYGVLWDERVLCAGFRPKEKKP